LNILLLNQFFWPDGAPTSQLLTDLAIHLEEHGHSVTVICGSSSYADASSSQAPKVRIIRTLNLSFAHGAMHRLLSYLTFYAGALWHGFQVARPDLVVTLTTPPLLSLAGTLLKAFRGARHFSWEMDVYPDVAVDLNVFRSASWSSRLTGFLADYARERADGIIALGECMRGRLMARGIPSEKIHIAENWADGNLIRPQPASSSHCLTVLYSGNLGLPHDVDTISAAMDELNADDRFHFLFIGAGPRRKSLEQFCQSKKLSHVSFAPHLERDQLSQSLASAHIGLVTQKAECLGSVVPSKVYGLMAAGRPVLFIGPRQATPSLIIERYECGWQVDCGDESGVVSLLQRLAAEPTLVRKAGFRARQAFVEHYDLPIRLSRLCNVLGVTQQTPPERAQQAAAG
jgi:glycosyltransferase involved in cell wall biosynthesis